MPSRADHLRQARENHEFVDRLLRQLPTDPTAVQWAVTVAYYCALHCLDAHLAGRGPQPANHGVRARMIADPTNGIPPPVGSAYHVLRQRSEDVRYRLATYTADDVQRIVVDRFLKRVTDFVGL